MGLEGVDDPTALVLVESDELVVVGVENLVVLIDQVQSVDLPVGETDVLVVFTNFLRQGEEVLESPLVLLEVVPEKLIKIKVFAHLFDVLLEIIFEFIQLSNIVSFIKIINFFYLQYIPCFF